MGAGTSTGRVRSAPTPGAPSRQRYPEWTTRRLARRVFELELVCIGGSLSEQVRQLFLGQRECQQKGFESGELCVG